MKSCNFPRSKSQNWFYLAHKIFICKSTIWTCAFYCNKYLNFKFVTHNFSLELAFLKLYKNEVWVIVEGQRSLKHVNKQNEKFSLNRTHTSISIWKCSENSEAATEVPFLDVSFQNPPYCTWSPSASEYTKHYFKSSYSTCLLNIILWSCYHVTPPSIDNSPIWPAPLLIFFPKPPTSNHIFWQYYPNEIWNKHKKITK